VIYVELNEFARKVPFEVQLSNVTPAGAKLSDKNTITFNFLTISREEADARDL
jgi:hypothetical protein